MRTIIAGSAKNARAAVREQHAEPEDGGGEDQVEGAVPGARSRAALPGARRADAAGRGQRRADVVRERGDEEGGAAGGGGACAALL